MLRNVITIIRIMTLLIILLMRHVLLDLFFRNYKDVALISLANVLHRARYSNEAAIVVQAAIDISKELNVNHFTLGNIYAVCVLI